MTPHTPLLARLSTARVGAIEMSDAVVIQPIGAFEQHGPHLPLDTDALVAETVTARAVAALPDDANVWILPTLRYGKSNEHGGRAGTISLSASTLIALLHDVGASVAASGFRKLVFVNAHGGQPQLLEMVSRDIRAATGLQVFPVSAMHLGEPEGMTWDDEGFSIHGGQSETSVVLAIDESLVDLDAAAAGGVALGSLFAGFTHLTLEGAVPTAWLTDDVSTNGVIGDPRRSRAELGTRVLEHWSAALSEALLEIKRFEWPELS